MADTNCYMSYEFTPSDLDRLGIVVDNTTPMQSQDLEGTEQHLFEEDWSVTVQVFPFPENIIQGEIEIGDEVAMYLDQENRLSMRMTGEVGPDAVPHIRAYTDSKGRRCFDCVYDLREVVDHLLPDYMSRLIAEYFITDFQYPESKNNLDS